MKRTITQEGFKWWEPLGFADRKEFKEFLRTFRDLPDIEEPPPSKERSEDAFPAPKEGSNEIAGLIRSRTRVEGMEVEEVWDARVNMMQSLVMNHLQMYANRKKFETGELKLEMRGEKGEVKKL